MSSHGRVRIKICGLTNEADAVAAIEAGADALGFNGFAGSKRFIDLAAESVWMAALPPLVSRVAVVVNPTAQEAHGLLALPGVDVLQFHGDETAEFCDPFQKCGFIKAFSARDLASLEAAARFGTGSVLLDAFVPGAYGGTGKLIDLPLAAAFVRKHPQLRVILSGGLAPENVAEAVRVVRPYAVDVASGVEMKSEPRRKDHSLMKEFIAAVREGSEKPGL